MKLKKMALHEEHEFMSNTRLEKIFFSLSLLLLLLPSAITGQTLEKKNPTFNVNSLIYSEYRKVSSQEANEWVKTQNRSWRSSSDRKALIKYGEKARNGIHFLPPLPKDSVISFINGYISSKFNGEPILIFFSWIKREKSCFHIRQISA